MIIDIAGIAIEVPSVRPFVRDMLEPFATTASPQVEISSSALEQHTQAIIEGQSRIKRLGPCEFAALLELVHNALVEYDGMFFHCALVELGGAAYALAGPSGAGKSTLARLWRDHLGATIVNGDKPFLRKMPDGWYAASSPWVGKELWGNPGCFEPLKGICFTRQAAENTIERIEPAQAVELILRQTRIPNTYAGAHALLDLVDSLASDIPIYVLHGNATEATSDLSWHTMSDR